jgi:hypothetical protein
MLAIQQLAGTGVRFLGIKDINSKDLTYTEVSVNDSGKSKTIRIDH